MRIVLEFQAKNQADLIQQIVAFLAEEPASATPAQAKTGPATDPVDAAAPTLDDVRAAFGDLVRAGRAAKAKQILAGFGAANISTLDPARYAEAVRLATSPA